MPAKSKPKVGPCTIGELFPDCDIHYCAQRSPEWFELRRGLLTASAVGAWIFSKKTATAKKARETAICKLIADTAQCWKPDQFESEAMRRGSELEPEAVSHYEKVSGEEVMEVGFCRSKFGLFGCSPDGLIVGRSSGLEGKIPLPETHIKYRRAGELPPEYKLQVKMSMAVTGAENWIFQSYNPGLANLRVFVKRDDEVEEMKAALIEFSGELEEALQNESAAWQQEFGTSK